LSVGKVSIGIGVSMSEKLKADVTILGGGPGGYVAAIRASQVGAKVVLVERDKLGGTCTNKGCVPTKSLINIGRMLSSSNLLKVYGINVDSSTLDFAKIMSKANSIAGEGSKHIEVLMRKNDIKVLKGSGMVVDYETIRVLGDDGDEKIINTSSIIIATGSSPLIPPIPGVKSDKMYTSDDMFNHYERPKKIVIIGAGAVGLEWGNIYNNFGSEVTIIEMMTRILPREDEEITEFLKEILEEKGIHIITGKKVNKITNFNDGIILNLEGNEQIKGDLALLAVGRVPNTKGIGLEKLVDMNNGRIIVDNYMKTKTKNMFAVGDVVGRWMLAHVAIQEGLVAGENAAGGDTTIKYDVIPRCVYTDPEVAFVGLSEKEAVEQRGKGIKTSFYPLRANSKAMSLNKTKGGIKLVYEEKYGELLGAQIVTPMASELIGELCVAIQIQATIDDLGNTIHAHPTISEIIREDAMRGLGRELHI
jgi:dihydrolipoamide dehydrogenase